SIVDEFVATERCLDSVRRREAAIVAVKKIVVGAAGAGVHRALSRPEKDSVAAVGHRVVGDDILRALLVDQKIGGVLTASIKSFAVSAHVVIDVVVHDLVAIRSVQADAESGIEREVVVPDVETVSSYHHQAVHSLSDGVAADLARLD